MAMKKYQLDFRSGVLREIDRLPSHLHQRVKHIILGLADNPRPDIAQELHDDLRGYYKIKLGDWRIVYRIGDEILVVTVIKVGKKVGPEFYRQVLNETSTGLKPEVSSIPNPQVTYTAKQTG